MKYRNFDLDHEEIQELLNMSDSVLGVVVDIVKEQSLTMPLEKIDMYSVSEVIMKEVEEEALRNTTAGKFRQLELAIKQCGCSTEEACKAAQKLGEALNSVPPYNYERRKSVCILGIIKTAIIVMTLLSIIFLLSKQFMLW